jgi:hypothetical protein
MAKKSESTREKIIRDVDAFCKEYGLQPSSVMRAAVGDSRSYDRLKKGGSLFIDSMDDLYGYMEEYRSNHQPKKG